MSRTTTNLGLTAVTNSETIGDFSDAMNASGGNLDIIDGKMGAVGNTSLQAQVNALNSKLATTYGSIDGQEITWERTGNVVIIYFNGKNVTTSSAWATLVTLPSGFPTSRYSVHVRTVTDQDLRLSGDNISYRGTGGGIFGAIVYLTH